ncbi:hypothetical protein HPG69_002284 [Diceros bicornis minor]|uniref:Uncharacterized protein n=1 Tax=Diceros bicornis minor TaxID=77932 RepID=A0A7J7FCP5_DICBM|nr:hypothetical protein HPG69_002284 [Diceros bicornis minor]
MDSDSDLSIFQQAGDITDELTPVRSQLIFHHQFMLTTGVLASVIKISLKFMFVFVCVNILQFQLYFQSIASCSESKVEETKSD